MTCVGCRHANIKGNLINNKTFHSFYPRFINLSDTEFTDKETAILEKTGKNKTKDTVYQEQTI